MAHRALLTDDQQLDRYLKIGTQGTFFLPGQNKAFQRRNIITILIDNGRGKEAVEAIVRVNREKTYLKREPLLYFLALAAHSNDAETKKAAYASLNEVCTTPTDLFIFLKHIKILSQFTKGWGRALRRGVSSWYNTKDPVVLAELVTRFTHLGRWSHQDVFRMSHIKPENESLNFIVKVMTQGFEKAKKSIESPSAELKPLIAYFMAVELVKHTDDGVASARLIEQHNLKMEHIPSTLLNSKEVWNTLISTFTLEEVLQHLPALARRTFLTIPVKGNPVDEVLTSLQSRVMEKIGDTATLEKDKVSPFVIYEAMRQYMRVFEDKKQKKKDQSSQTGPWDGQRGKKDMQNEVGAEPSKKKKKKKKKKGKDGEHHHHQQQQEDDHLTKDIGLAASQKVKQNNPELWESLHVALRHAIEKNLPTCSKRVLVAVKACTSAIGQGIRGMPAVTPLETMALMAAFYKRMAKERELGFFTASFMPMKYHSEIPDLIKEIGRHAAPVPNLNCDPAAPVIWALEKKRKFDVFLVLSDGHEAKGESPPSEKLLEYREAMGISDAKMVICGLTSPKLDFADAAGMLDIGSFDPTVPTLIHRFIQGEL